MRLILATFLGDNKIKFLNGKAFEASPKLSSVLLHNNECIAQSFHSKETIETVAKVVTELCGFFEEIKPSKFECGKVTYTGGYVIGGSQIKRGQWPFLVGLYHLEEKMFRCAGNLITNEFVLTGKTILSFKFKLLIEAFNLSLNINLSFELIFRISAFFSCALHSRQKPKRESYSR